VPAGIYGVTWSASFYGLGNGIASCHVAYSGVGGAVVTNDVKTTVNIGTFEPAAGTLGLQATAGSIALHCKGANVTVEQGSPQAITAVRVNTLHS